MFLFFAGGPLAFHFVAMVRINKVVDSVLCDTYGTYPMDMKIIRVAWLEEVHPVLSLPPGHCCSLFQIVSHMGNLDIPLCFDLFDTPSDLRPTTHEDRRVASVI